MTKHIVFFGSLSNTGGETLNEPAQSSTTGAPVWSTDKSEFSHMDVLINVKTLTGTSPTVTISIRESFSDVTGVETGKTTTLSTTGKYLLANDGQSGQTLPTTVQYGMSMMGKGIDKQVVSTIGGTASAVAVDIYLIFWK